MNNCPCPTDLVPSNPCCPDTTDLGSSIDVRDKDCNPRRLRVNNAGVLAAKSGKAGMMDGSAAKPLTMDFETFFAADGYVLIQAPGGRIIAIKPNEDLTAANAVLQFVYQDGAFKLVPITHENLFSDEDVPSNSSGIMALIACGGPLGTIRLGKFHPFSQAPTGGPFPVVVDSNNVVRAGDTAIDHCPATDSVERLDTIIGCVEGKWKTLLPVKNKTLIGVETAGAVKWELKDSSSNVVSVPRVNIYSKTVSSPDAGASDTASINIATLAGYDVSYTFAMLHFTYRAATSTSDMTHEVALDGRGYIGVNLIAGSFQGEFNSNSSLVPIPTSKAWAFTNTRTFWQPGSASGQHVINIYLDGWVK